MYCKLPDLQHHTLTKIGAASCHSRQLFNAPLCEHMFAADGGGTVSHVVFPYPSYLNAEALQSPLLAFVVAY